MANGKAFDYWQGLPTWAKGVLAVGGLAIGYFAVRGVLSRIKREADAKNGIQATQDAKNDLADLARNGVKPTISKSQADSFAEQIVSQYKNADLLLQSFGVTERIFKQLKNNADFLLLRVSFGVRTYPDALWGNVKNVTLEGAIQDELTNFRISDLNAILAKNGITYSV